MNQEDLIDGDIASPNKDDENLAHIKKLRIRYFIVYLVITTVNYILFNTFERELYGMTPPDGTFNMLFIGSLAWGFILGLPFNLIPYKNMSYGKKYLSTSFIAAASVSSLFLILCIFYIVVRP